MHVKLVDNIIRTTSKEAESVSKPPIVIFTMFFYFMLFCARVINQKEEPKKIEIKISKS